MKDIRTVTPKDALSLLNIIGYPWGKSDKVTVSNTLQTSFNDQAVLSRMFKSKNGKTIEALYNGDISMHNNDDSRADMALLTHFAYWTGKNQEQMEHLWLGSPLGNRKKTQGRKDYRDRTINKAIEGCSETYSITETHTEKDEIMVMIPWREFSKKEFPETRWRIKGLIPIEGFVILSAISGEKKSWVALDMAKCIAKGVNFLNEEIFKTKKGRVLYVDQENPEREILRRGKQLKFDESADLFIYRPNSLNLNDEKVAETFLNLISENNINVVFIDTLRAVAGGLKEDKAEDVRMFFNRLKILKDKGVVVIWLDHRRKPVNFEGKVPKKEQLLGSQDKTASVEILLLLSSDSGTDEIRVYQAKSRIDREIPAFKIIMKDDVLEDGTKTTSLSYDGEIEDDETKKDEAKEAILELLEGESKTTNEIISVLAKQKRIGGKNIRVALKELVAEGIIDYGKEKRQHLYFLSKKEGVSELGDS